MLTQRIHHILKTIADETYPGLILPFTIDVIPKEMRGRHGDYHPVTHHIRIFNLSRDTVYVIATALHELAHHCDQCLRGATDHSKSFYACLRDILAAAIRRGFINYHQARQVTDARDIRMLEKHFGDFLRYYKELDSGDGSYFVKVLKAYTVKDHLKERGYRWSELEVAWCREIPCEAVEAERTFLADLVSLDQFSITRSQEAKIEAVYHVIVDGGYELRHALKERGYLFRGYGYEKGNNWVRRIPAQKIAEEKEFLVGLGCQGFKIEGKKTQKR